MSCKPARMLVPLPRPPSSGSCSDHSGLGWLIVMGVLQLFTTEPASLMRRAFAAVVEMSIPRSSMLVPLPEPCSGRGQLERQGGDPLGVGRSALMLAG